MPYAPSSQGNVCYEVHGEGPALVFAHGGGGNHASWWQQVPWFRDRYRVITFDFPGFGRSDSPRDEYDVRDYPDVLLAVLDHAGIEQATLVGHSLGCLPALVVAVRDPKRVAAVVVCQSTGGINDPEFLEQAKADREAAKQLTALERLMSKEFPETNPERVFLFSQISSFNRAKPGGAVKNTRDALINSHDVRGAISAGVRVVFLQTLNDVILSEETYRLLSQVLPEAEIETIDGPSHSVYWEAPEIWNRALDRILHQDHPPV